MTEKLIRQVSILKHEGKGIFGSASYEVSVELPYEGRLIKFNEGVYDSVGSANYRIREITWNWMEQEHEYKFFPVNK